MILELLKVTSEMINKKEDKTFPDLLRKVIQRHGIGGFQGEFPFLLCVSMTSP